MGAISFKDGDERFLALECKTTDQVVLLGQSGKTYTLAVASLPTGRGDGVPVNTLIGSDGDDIRWIGSGRPETLYLLTTTAGNGFMCRLADMVTRIKAGKEFMTVPEGAIVRPAQPVWDTDAPPKFADKAMLAALSSDSRMLLFPLADVPTRANGGVGVQLIALPDGITLASAAVSDGKSLVIVGERRGKVAEEVLQGDLLAQHYGKRAQRGRVVDVRFKVSHLKGTA